MRAHDLAYHEVLCNSPSFSSPGSVPDVSVAQSEELLAKLKHTPPPTPPPPGNIYMPRHQFSSRDVCWQACSNVSPDTRACCWHLSLEYMVMYRQKLDPLDILHNLFQVDLIKKSIKGRGHAGALFCATSLCCQRAEQPCSVKSICMSRCYPEVGSVTAVWCY